MPRPIAPGRWATSAESRRPRADRRAERAASARDGATLREPDPRVEPAIEQIYEHVRQHEDERGHEHGGLHERIVALKYGRHGESPDPRPREDRFRDDRAPEERAQLQPDDGDD